MPATVKAPLGSSTNVRKWFFDVNTATFAAPIWVGVFGMTEFKPKREGSLEEDSDFDSDGFESTTKTAEKWGVELKVRRAVTKADSTAYDPGQEFLRLRSIGKFGSDNSVDVRYYEMQPNGPRIEAYRGTASVSWEPEGGEMKKLDMVSIKLAGQGALVPIAHPDA